MSAPRRRRDAGMTLIELLLAVMLFAGIAASMGIVLNVAFGSLNRIDSKIDFTRRVLASQRTLDQILSGLIPVNAPCGGRPIGFVGLSNAVRFVSSHSLTEAARGRPQVVDLFVGPSPNGGFRLMLNERPFFGKLSLANTCSMPFDTLDTSFILADRLAYARFSYRKIDFESGQELWAGGWNFLEWPSGIRIEMAPNQWLPNQILPTNVFSQILVKNNNLDEQVY